MTEAITVERTTTIDELITAHSAALLNYATRLMGGNRSAAEDVVQETWIRAWRHLDRLSETRGSVRGWLMRVAHNIAIDHHRARQARPSEIEWSDIDDQRVPSTQDVATEVENRIIVSDLLATVSPMHRATLTEVYLEDRTMAHAAEILGVPAGTVKSRVFHALRSLRTTALPAAA